MTNSFIKSFFIDIFAFLFLPQVSLCMLLLFYNDNTPLYPLKHLTASQQITAHFRVHDESLTSRNLLSISSLSLASKIEHLCLCALYIDKTAICLLILYDGVGDDNTNNITHFRGHDESLSPRALLKNPYNI